MSEPKVHWGGEVQLMGFGESDSSGAWIKFQITPEDLEHFRGLKGNCFDMLLANMENTIGEEIKKGGKMAQEAGKICKNRSFQEYASAFYRNKYKKETPVSEDIARSMILEWCNVASRKGLDQELPKKRFIQLMSHYRNWNRAQSVV